MTEERARELLMEYLYDEMDPEQRVEFEKVLAESESLRTELAELKSTRSLIAMADTEEPPSGAYFKSNEMEKRERQGNSRSGLFFAAAALFLGAVLLTIVYTNIEITSGDGHFTITFGEPVQSVEQITREDLALVVEQIRSENSILAGLMADELERRQSDQIDEAITLLTQYYDRQRQRDLMLITESLYQFEEETDTRFRERDELVADLIYALANQ